MSRSHENKGLIFSGMIGDVIDLFRSHTEADPDAIAAQFLVTFGNIVGHGPHCVVGETRHYMNENLLVVGRSAKSRKGDSLNIAQRLFLEAYPEYAEQIVSGLSSGEGLIHNVRDPLGEDEGVADKRLLVAETEFSTPLKQFERPGNILSNVLRDTWDSKPVLRTLTKKSPTKATNAHISVIGHTTPADLNEHLSRTDIANGLGNRFLFVLATRARLLANPGRAPSDSVAALVGVVRETVERAKSVGEMTRTPACIEYWEQVYPHLSREHPGLAGELLARSEAHVLRLSALYALLAQKDTVDTEHLAAALAFWDLVERSVYEIFAGRTGSKEADKILEFMLPGQMMSLTEIRNNTFSNHVSGRKFTDAIQLLEELGEVSIESETTGGRTAINVTRLDSAHAKADQEATGTDPS